MMFKIAVHLLIIKTIACEYSVADKIYTPNNNYTATECIASVIQKYFPCGFLITLVDSRTNDELFKFLNRDNECYNFITRSFYDEDWSISTPVYIIRAENVSEFSEGILTITNDLFWNPRGRFVIELKTLGKDEVDEVFNILMTHYVYDVILIRKSTNEFVIDTYFPFKNNNCGKRVEVATLGDCKDIANLEWIREKKYSLRNCTIVIVATQNIPNFIFEESHFHINGKPLHGLEQLLFETIAEKDDIKLQYLLKEQKHNYGVVLPNHTATGLLTSLQHKEADIAAGGFILIRNRILIFDYAWGYNYVNFKVFTPSLGEEIWKDIYKVFSKETWLLILTAFCFVALTSTIRQRLFLRRNQYQSSITLLIWGYFFLNTSSKISKDKRFKTVMLLWIWFTFFMCNFYNTELYSLLTRRTPIKRFISVDRLPELPYEPCINTAIRTYYLYAYNQLLPEGSNNSECQFADYALDYVATQKKSYAVDFDYKFELFRSKYSNEDGTSKLDTWTFSHSQPIAMYFNRGFPLRDEFQYYALRMYESGILKKNLLEIYRKNNHRPEPIHKIHYKPMCLADFRIHFYIILLGHVLSMMCFIFEILWYRNFWRFRHISYTD